MPRQVSAVKLEFLVYHDEPDGSDITHRMIADAVMSMAVQREIAGDFKDYVAILSTEEAP